ncbi:MAG: hypothetical protein JNL03_02110, partial [Prolixibacteraceae bacterium]|nr:hypothetical protein [Prolixibacteraceae bacterium]
WYWQFNLPQGYKHDGAVRTPSNAWTAWITSITANASWALANDPCNLLIGLGWRIPPSAEWTAADAPPQNWTNITNAFNSELKMHAAGYLNYTNGTLANRGSYGYYWTSTQYSSTSYGNFLTLYNGSSVSYADKAYAFPLRCIRDGITITKPVVSSVTLPAASMTSNSAAGTATVVSDGGANITERGLCWNTSGNPTTADVKISAGNVIGSFTSTLTGLAEGPTYYVRAYAVNSQGTAYSPTVSSFKICPSTFPVAHTEGQNGAPVSKTVTYRSVSSNISGKAACWLTQNLGADRQATSAGDAAEAAAGWYWQFNRVQGYKYDGSRIPSNTWITSISASANWAMANDPCNLLLGLGWRIPTSAEWTAADAPPQYWTSVTDAYASELKLHSAGYLNTGGGLTGRGSYGFYWSSTQYASSSYGNFLNLYGGSVVSYVEKANALPLRCIRD